jgi:acetylornithine deacetylase
VSDVTVPPGLSPLEARLAQLVAIDSTSSRPNAPVIDLLEPLLRKAGFETQRQTYADAAGTPKINLLAHLGAGVPELALVGHTDCVPFDPAWPEALHLTPRDGKLYGRGSCDTKAFIACALEAGLRAAARPLKKGLLLVFTADEEVGCVGAKQLVDAKLGRARYAIVGEPTSLRPIRAHKGYCLAEVEVLGKEGHSAYPDSGASAIFRAARLLERIERLAKEVLRPEQDAAFVPPYTTVNVGVIEGGKAKNIIPGSCRFVLEWRPIPSQPVERVAELVEGLLARLREEEPGFEARLTLRRADRGVDTASESEVVRFVQGQTGKAPETVSFGTEAPQLTALGAQAVVFGPGDILVAHQTGEYVPRAELARCEAVLDAAIAHFCG